MQRSLYKKSAVKGGSSKGKEPVIDVDNLSPRPKRTRSPIGVFDPDKFRSYVAFQNYDNYFKEALLLVERAIEQVSLLETKILNGLPSRIGTTYFPTLMMHMRTW